MMELLQLHFHHWVAIFLMMAGLYVTIASPHIMKKLMGLGIFQTSILLFFISIAWRHGGIAPIYKEGHEVYTAPLPHVLMLTAIVVGVATLAVGLALVVRLKKAYGTCYEDDMVAMDNADMLAGDQKSAEALRAGEEV